LHVADNNVKALSIAFKTQEWVLIALLSTNKIFRGVVNSLILLRSCHLSDILTNFNKFGFFRHIFMEVPKIKIHKNRPSGSRPVKCEHTENKQKDRRMTDRREEANRCFSLLTWTRPKMHTFF